MKGRTFKHVRNLHRVLSFLLATSFAVESQAQIEEIIVTATKRVESLQDVAVSLVAMMGEQISEIGIGRGSEFTANVPAVTIAQNPITNFIFIRGVGTAGANTGIEQSVSIFHDGIYMGRHQLSRAPFMDLDRVEVLRGPQGILFGKNTIGGAIHIVAAKPTDSFEGSLSALAGEDGELEYSAVVSGPLGDRLRGRLAYRGYEYDGFLTNVLNNVEGPQREDETIRAQLEWDLRANVTVNAKWESSTYDQVEKTTQLSTVNPFTPRAIEITELNQILVGVATGSDGVESIDDERAVVNDGGALLGQVVPALAGLPGFPSLDEFSNNESDAGSINIEWSLGDHVVNFVTGFAEYEFQDTCDCDFSALPLIDVDSTEKYDQFSQEIRITSPAGEKLEYIAGLYYQDSDLKARSIEGFGTALLAPAGLSPILFPNIARDYTFDQEQETRAIFGSATWNFNDTTRGTLGLRYSEETKKANHRLDKLFTVGWDYSPLFGLPAGTLAFGNTPADYDAFVANPALALPVAIVEQEIFTSALGTFEHDITRERDEDFVTWSLGLEHNFGDTILGYATVATGVKGGGFDARFLRTNDSPFFEYDEEEALSYELGLKSTLLNGNLTFNAALFQSTVEDYQVSIFDGATAFFVQNAAEIESKGIEVDLKWLATDSLLVSFSGVYLDAAYTDFPNAPCFVGSMTDNRGDCIGRGTPTAFRDATGDNNFFSPEFSFNLNLNYTVPVSDALALSATANINYSDEYVVAGDGDPIYGIQDSYTKYDVRLALGRIDGKWEIALLGKNLSDEFTSGSSNDQPLIPGNGFVFTDRLRSYAIQAKYNF